MSITIPSQGEIILLDSMTGFDMDLRLYTTDVTSGLTDAQIDALTESSFTEATFTGYSAKTLTGASWTTTAGTPSTAVYAAQTFTCTSDGALQNVYGYYVTRSSDGDLIYFERFASPIQIQFAADALTITPRMTLDERDGELVPVGAVIATASSSVPDGYLACDGSAVSRTTYAALFAEIGTTYGSGDGSTTFNVPDMRQRFPLGKAASGTGSTLGGTGGDIDHTHDHNGTDAAAAAELNAADGDLYGRWVACSSYSNTRKTVAGPYSANTATSTTGIALVGSTQSGNPPFLALNYLIKT